VAYSPCEGDELEKTLYADENHDGVDEALFWIKYPTYDGEEVSGTRIYLDVADAQAKPQTTVPLWMSPHWPPFWPQMFCGRHVQLGAPAHEAGSGAQNGEGGVHGGGTQPILLGVPQHSDCVQPVAH
jgi:hypothetical protein